MIVLDGTLLSCRIFVFGIYFLVNQLQLRCFTREIEVDRPVCLGDIRVNVVDLSEPLSCRWAKQDI